MGNFAVGYDKKRGEKAPAFAGQRRGKDGIWGRFWRMNGALLGTELHTPVGDGPQDVP